MDLTDENGNLSASYDQDAFGNVLAGIQSGYHLTTKEFSPLINLYYFFQRWYNAQIGRFIIKSNFPPDQEHPYAYCENNPVSLVDVSGEYPNGEIHKIAFSLSQKNAISRSKTRKQECWDGACAARMHDIEGQDFCSLYCLCMYPPVYVPWHPWFPLPVDKNAGSRDRCNIECNKKFPKQKGGNYNRPEDDPCHACYRPWPK